MASLPSVALAAGAVALFAFALWGMTAGRFGLAGVSFLSASVVIYFRETLSTAG